MEKKTLTNVQAIKTFFERMDSITPDGGRKLGIQELKQLTAEDKKTLGPLCAAELGVEIAAS